ncbi:hypothetical protein V2O64_03000 [Verrucomicrobiaceae bacterium 227]
MKTLLPLLTLAMGCSIARAAPPENYPTSRYIDLYRNSPFTDPPEVIEPENIPNDLQDWTMVGLRKSVDSVVVTLLNTKNRNERIRIPSKEASEMGFAIREVKYERNFLNSEVILQKGQFSGKVTFDPKYLVLKAVSAPAAAGSPNRGNSNTKGRTPTAPGNSPPIPGSKPGTTTKPSTGSKVPIPGGSTRPSTTSTKSTGRTRYVPRPKK